MLEQFLAQAILAQASKALVFRPFHFRDGHSGEKSGETSGDKSERNVRRKTPANNPAKHPAKNPAEM